MAQKKIHIVWRDGKTVDISLLEDNPVAEYYYHCIKHLQHVDLEFNARKNPLHGKQITLEEVINELVIESKKVNLSVDRNLLKNQEYLNTLHSIYFDNASQTTFDVTWLKVHDCIHMIEDLIKNFSRNTIWFDYEDKAGPLIKPFDRSLLDYAVHERTAGMCFIGGHELGKTPDLYWQHGEPADAEVMCTLSKPWRFLKPVLSVCIQDGNIEKENFNEETFNKWFEPIQDAWRKHWNFPDWTPDKLFLGIPIGQIEDLPTLIDRFTKLDYPQKLTL